jgi:hypothetical protein
MALADTVNAIGAVTDTLVERLGFRTKLQVSVGRPEPPAQVTAAGRLNLFLYEINFDASLKNTSLDEGQAPPLWLVLKYLLTAFDDDGKSSDTMRAQDYLGVAVGALQEFSFLPLLPPLASLPHMNALKDNPENLKLTFDEAPLDLLSKAMQGANEQYRLSVAFQVRPVMIAPAEVPSYSQLVGVDYTTSPVTIVGETDIHVAVLPSLGPTITKIQPANCQLGDTVSIFGADLHLSDLSVSFGPVTLPATMQRPEQLQFVVRPDIANGGTISAGSLPVSVSQLLPSGRRRSSNLLVVGLRPTFNASVGAITTITAAESHPPPEGWKFATVNLSGELLGKNDSDDFVVALNKNGETVKVFENDPSTASPLGHLADTSPAAAPQTAKQLVMLKSDSVPPGKYFVLYRVNGQQALQGPELDLT